MAETLKILGQSAPSATTDTELYQVPASTTATISSITVCNRSAVSVTFRIRFDVADSGVSNEQYLVYDATLGPNDLYTFTGGVTLGAADTIDIYASTANLSFQAFGVEVS